MPDVSSRKVLTKAAGKNRVLVLNSMHRNMIMDKAQNSAGKNRQGADRRSPPGIGDPRSGNTPPAKKAPEIIAGH